MGNETLPKPAGVSGAVGVCATAAKGMSAKTRKIMDLKFDIAGPFPFFIGMYTYCKRRRILTIFSRTTCMGIRRQIGISDRAKVTQVQALTAYGMRPKVPK